MITHQGALSDQGFTIRPTVTQTENEVRIRISIDALEMGEKTLPEGVFTTLEIAEAGYTVSPGKPLLPFIGKFYQISDTLAPVVSLEIIHSSIRPIHHPVLPAQEDQEIADIERIESRNAALYASDNWFPRQRILAEDPVILRDVRLLPVVIYPIRYNPASQTLEIIEEAEIVIRYEDRESPNILTNPGNYSPSFEQLYEALIPNYKPRAYESRDVAESYLLIMDDAFESRFQGFIAWKEAQGFDVDILLFSEMGGNPTAATVKSRIQALYDLGTRPVYASIVGSTNNFPVYQSYDDYHPGNYDNDLYYSQLAGADLLPDLFLSRYPAVNETELSTMLNRILRYEQAPQMDNPEFYKTAMMACSNLYASQQVTKEQTRDRLYTNLDYTTVHEMYDWHAYSDPVSMIMGWFNQGVSIINYRGEGWQSGWHPLHEHQYYIEYPEIYTINNPGVWPVITSIGCGVSMFDGYQDCFAHAWVAHGTPSEPLGAVAFLGPTWNTRTTINNWIDRGMYRGFCYHDITRSGPINCYGKIYAYEHFLGTEYMTNDIPTHMREYVLFGNPDMWWRTDIPRGGEVHHAWPPANSGHGIVVIDETGRKVANSQISFIKDSSRRVYWTDGGGGCPIQMSDIVDPIPYTLTGWNLLPATGTFDLPETGDDGDIVITEIKPDIETSGTSGDMVEIANLETMVSINLMGWTIGDLDGYDLPLVNQNAVLEPHKVAVIEFVGYDGTETVTAMDYGLYITSRAVIGLSSEEDTCVVRNTQGRVRDAVCWHNGTGIGSTNEALDMSKLTQPSSFVSMGFRAWWTGPDEVPRENYETYAVNWSAYAGNGGPGSIQRAGLPGSGVYDSPAYFTVSSTTNFGYYGFPAPTGLISGSVNPKLIIK